MIAELRDFTVVTKLIKNFKSLYGFGGRCFNIRDVCMDFEPCFKVYNLVSIRPKSMKLGQMTNLNMIFHMVGSVYRLVTIRNSPQFPISEWPIEKDVTVTRSVNHFDDDIQLSTQNNIK